MTNCLVAGCLDENVLEQIIFIAQKFKIEKLFLFGSRARGDFKRTSDIDLAVVGGDFAEFLLAVNEDVSTLLCFDVVNLSGVVQKQLLESINREGILIYEKFENFIKSFENLKEIFNYDQPFDNVVLTGLVALYEICFEQSWKAMKEVLENDGIDDGSTGSPRQILNIAFKVGMIEDEKQWLDALVARNNVSHSYNKDIAITIVTDTKDTYFNLFEKLKTKLENWTI